jgi:hypothetical protein
LGRVDDALKARVDRGEQITQAADPPRLVCHQLASASDEQPDFDVELGGGLDGTQVAAVADLVGDHRGVTRVALVLAAGRSLAGPVDGQARDMDDVESRLEQHHGEQRRDTADDVDPHAQLAVLGPQRLELVDQRGQRGRLVIDAAVHQQLAALAADCPDPMELLRHVDPDGYPHVTPPGRGDLVLLAPDSALHSDESRCLISGVGEAAGRGDQPPEPSTAASMKSIPVPPTTEGRAA